MFDTIIVRLTYPFAARFFTPDLHGIMVNGQYKLSVDHLNAGSEVLHIIRPRSKHRYSFLAYYLPMYVVAFCTYTYITVYLVIKEDNNFL
jgi:hypothetical protein